MSSGTAHYSCRCMEQSEFREKQYQRIFSDLARGEYTSLGLMSSSRWETDPKTFLFSLARYKFVSKMLRGCDQVLEIGCGDGFQSRIVKQEVSDLTISDFDPVFISDFESRNVSGRWPTKAIVHDFCVDRLDEQFDAAYALDVLEHIDPHVEHVFLGNVCASLRTNGVLIVGMPSLESQRYASEQSMTGHVNCQTGSQLKSTMERHFRNVFCFSMNDEVVHTGFEPMAHYLFALCVTPIR